MKISIITATYNSEKSIEDTVRSILSQSYTNYEMVVIDGASSDKTLLKLEKLTESIKDKVKVISEPDKGIYDALNKGISNSTGDLIAFLHADDFYNDINVLANVVKTFEDSCVDSVYGDLLYVSKENINNTVRYWQSGFCSLRKMRNGWMPPHPSFFVKKDIYDKYGNFDLGLSIAADYDFMMRVLYKEKISVAYLPKILVKMRTGGASNKSLKNIIEKSRQDLIAMKKNGLGGLFSLFIKNLRKLPQFFTRSNDAVE